jgi:tetratricopeptide (TPR) repeat protein
MQNVIDIYCQLGNLYKSADKLKYAEANFTDAIEYAEKTQNAWYTGIASKGLAKVLISKKQYRHAEDLLQTAVENLQQFDDLFELADTYYELANCSWYLPDFEQNPQETIGYFSKAFDIFNQINDNFNCGYCLYSLGIIYNLMGQSSMAYNYLQRSKALISGTYPDYDISFIDDVMNEILPNLPPESDKPGPK